MDEVHAETTMTEGPLLEERLPSTKAAFKHQTQGLTLDPTFGSPTGDIQFLYKVLNLPNSYFVHCLFAAVQCSLRDVTQTPFNDFQMTYLNSNGK